MKRILFLICLLLQWKLSATQEPLFVSLGSSCEASHQLRKLNLRAAAYPLDWALSVENDYLMLMLDEQFANFTQEKYLAVHQGVLIHTYYHLVMPHEGSWKPHDYAKTLAIFQQKYARRIQRFREIKNYEGPVFFVRAAYFRANDPKTTYRDKENIEISDAWAELLFDKLKQCFPKLNFKLIILNLYQETEPRIEWISDSIIKAHYNGFLDPTPKLELCKKTFLKIMRLCKLTDTQTYFNLKQARPPFPN